MNVLHHNVLSNVKKAVDEIERLTKKEGVVLLTLVSTRDYKYGSGEEIEKTRSSWERDLRVERYIISFDKREVENLLSRFKVIELNHDKIRLGPFFTHTR